MCRDGFGILGHDTIVEIRRFSRNIGTLVWICDQTKGASEMNLICAGAGYFDSPRLLSSKAL